MGSTRIPVNEPLDFLPERVHLFARRRQDEHELLSRIQDRAKPIPSSTRQQVAKRREFRAGARERIHLASTPGIVAGKRRRPHLPPDHPIEGLDQCPGVGNRRHAPDLGMHSEVRRAAGRALRDQRLELRRCDQGLPLGGQCIERRSHRACLCIARRARRRSNGVLIGKPRGKIVANPVGSFEHHRNRRTVRGVVPGMLDPKRHGLAKIGSTIRDNALRSRRWPRANAGHRFRGVPRSPPPAPAGIAGDWPNRVRQKLKECIDVEWFPDRGERKRQDLKRRCQRARILEPLPRDVNRVERDIEQRAVLLGDDRNLRLPRREGLGDPARRDEPRLPAHDAETAVVRPCDLSVVLLSFMRGFNAIWSFPSTVFASAAGAKPRTDRTGNFASTSRQRLGNASIGSTSSTPSILDCCRERNSATRTNRSPIDGTRRSRAAVSTAAMSAIRMPAPQGVSPFHPCRYQASRHARSEADTPIGSIPNEAW